MSLGYEGRGRAFSYVTAGDIHASSVATDQIDTLDGDTLIHRVNTDNFGVGINALNTAVTGTDNVAFGPRALDEVTTGSRNVAVGVDALDDVTIGNNNTGVGYHALFRCTSGTSNTAVGMNTLINSGAGSRNTAIGASTLFFINTGSDNVAVGNSSMINATGALRNTAIGTGALPSILTGNDNIALGYAAGVALTLGDSENICIGHPGVVGDSGVMRIGTPATHAKAYVSGVFGVTTDMGAPAVAVLVDSDGQLGITSSSRRYKENIVSLSVDEAMTAIMGMNPVRFSYKQHRKSSANQYGLIAEEMDAILPNLVVHDEGETNAIAYHQLHAFYVKILQHNCTQIEQMQAQMTQMQAQIDLFDK